MDIQQREFIKFPMSMLNRIGIFCLHETSIKQSLLCVCFGILLSICVFSAIPQYFYMNRTNIFEFVDNTEAVAGLGQVLVKLILAAYSKQEFMRLLQLLNQFWNSDKSSKLLKSKINGLLQAVVIFQKVFFYVLTVGIVPIFVLALFFGKKLPLGTWIIENQESYYKFLLTCHILNISCISPFLACFDGLFLGICYEIIIQFKILSYRLENLSVTNIQSQQDFDVFYQELKSNIQHHIFLLRFIKEMQKVYSPILIIQYLTMAPLICTEIFVSSTSTDVLWMIRYGCAGVSILGQFALYCIPVSLVIEEVIKADQNHGCDINASVFVANADAAIVSYGIYNSDWFSKTFPQLRVPIILLIQASQNEIEFKARGLIAININTLFTVAKVAFSASAVFKKLKE